MNTSIRGMGWIAGLLSVALWLAGCTTPGITRVADDTFRVSRADPGQVFADDEAMKAAAVADANAFASSRGMVAVPVSVDLEVLPVGHLRTLNYEFRLVAPTAAVSAPMPPAGSTAPSTVRKLEYQIEVVTPAAAAAVAASPDVLAPLAPAAVAPPLANGAPAKSGHSDTYDELIRLDDLRRRGILTDAEFQTLKAKIIADR